MSCVLKNVCEPPHWLQITISVYAVVPKNLTLMCHLGLLHFVISGPGIAGLPRGKEAGAGISIRSTATRCVSTHVAQHLLRAIPTTECVPAQRPNINTCLAFKCMKGMNDVSADKS